MAFLLQIGILYPLFGFCCYEENHLKGIAHPAANIYFHQPIPQFDFTSSIPKAVTDLGSTKYSDRCNATIDANGRVSLHVFFSVKIHPLLLDSVFNSHHSNLLNEVIAHELGHVKQLSDILESPNFSIHFKGNFYKGSFLDVLMKVIPVIQLEAIRACNGNAESFQIELKNGLDRFLRKLLLTAYESVCNDPESERMANNFALTKLGQNAAYINRENAIDINSFFKGKNPE